MFFNYIGQFVGDKHVTSKYHWSS